MLFGRHTRDSEDACFPLELNSYVTALSLQKSIEELKHSIHSWFIEMAAHQNLLMGNTGTSLHIDFEL